MGQVAVFADRCSKILYRAKPWQNAVNREHFGQFAAALLQNRSVLELQ